MTTIRRKAISNLTFEAAPFPGETELNEFESDGNETSYEYSSRRWGRPRSSYRRRPPMRRRQPAPSSPLVAFPFAPLAIIPEPFAVDSASPYDTGASAAYGDPTGFAPDDSFADADGPESGEWEWATPEMTGVFSEWLGEVSRSSSEYVRWVQQSLNKILGLRLDVDGISGTQTRSAVRSFQQRAGITVDGIVGPQTEASLMKFGAAPPPGYSGGTPTTIPNYGGTQPSFGGSPSFAGGSGFQFVQVRGIENTTQAFRDKTANIAQSLNMDPNYLMAIMSFESSLNPQAVNENTHATGLIQFMPKTAQRLGTTTDALRRMSGEQQLDYVYKYFAPYKGKLGTLEDAYMAVLYPSAMGKGPDHVLFSSPSDAYRFNDSLDSNHDGKITVAEATSFVRQRLPAGYKTGSGGGTTTPPITSGPTSGIVTVGGIKVAQSIAAQVANLLAAAEKDGLTLTGGGWRSPEAQINLRRTNCGPTHYDIYEKPPGECHPTTAKPGTSNHEKGLAIDFDLNGDEDQLDVQRADPRFKWLQANAARYGLYNKISNEPWHWSVTGY